MITKEQLIEQFGIKAGLTQDQFDRIINELRISEQLEKAPVYDALAAAEQENSNLKLRKMQLNIEIQQVSAEIGRLQQKNRVIGHAFYEAERTHRTQPEAMMILLMALGFFLEFGIAVLMNLHKQTKKYKEKDTYTKNW